ncbi:amino acid transporter AVT1I isoform X1 [Solanum pennellii]|uniref:Amino acid transporter AVT1I isoform X1 n=1 Tax=Solanum pennellii TaxID=28526 RepID=A0ABM1GU19_SOLPN|nr:amino acid transporter AVT1I isoform X1 [Solanum pennellii]
MRSFNVVRLLHLRHRTINRLESTVSVLQITQLQDIMASLGGMQNGPGANCSIGIISIPYALSQGGWLCLMLLLLVAIICCYTGILLQKCMSVSPSIKTYPDIGEFAFGNKGRILISIFLYLELYFVAIEFLILEGDNLQKLFPNAKIHFGCVKIVGREVFVLLVAIIILPTTWLKSLGLLAYVSIGGVLASIVLVFSIFWVGAIDGIGFEEKGVIWRWDGLISAISMYTFCYCGHAVFPTICNSMKDRSQFPKVLFVCFIVSTITYGSMATMGYLMYGQNLMSQITLNLPTGKISSKIAIYTTLVNPITKYALVVSPIATAIEDKLPLRKSKFIVSYFIRTLLVISTVTVALTVPFFGYVMAFTGALLGVTVSILLPCLCYLKIKKPSYLEIMFIVMILIFGSSVTLSGTYTSLKNIISHV